LNRGGNAKERFTGANPEIAQQACLLGNSENATNLSFGFGLWKFCICHKLWAKKRAGRREEATSQLTGP
jgi:hypothetical protein